MKCHLQNPYKSLSNYLKLFLDRKTVPFRVGVVPLKTRAYLLTEVTIAVIKTGRHIELLA
jgi:hypothetical protein